VDDDCEYILVCILFYGYLTFIPFSSMISAFISFIIPYSKVFYEIRSSAPYKTFALAVLTSVP
jgi:hypothetical protein